MVNTSKKGYSKEVLCRRELKAEGFFITFQSVRTRWATYDYGDLFDVCAYRGKERKFISCKHFTKGDYHIQHQAELKKFKDIYGYPDESYEMWLWSHARWVGRGKEKKWVEAAWQKIII
jgi:hypothetical protein